jgi:hypothetical protein
LDERLQCKLPPYPVPCAVVEVRGSAWIVDRGGFRLGWAVQVRLRGGTFIGSRRSNGIRRVCVLLRGIYIVCYVFPPSPPYRGGKGLGIALYAVRIELAFFGITHPQNARSHCFI